MNYMAEVAKMLGVEMNVDFECNDNRGYKYRITENGFTCSGCYGADCLMMILNGDLTIKRKPWKPKYNEEYYFINSTGHTCQEKWYGDVIDTLYYKLGNCYKHKDQADANSERWISFYTSDDVLEV